MKRKASADWKGSLKEGKESISTESGVLAHAQYSFGTRFESGIGTNPEELVAAAHAACFSMQLSALLGKTGLVPEQIATTAVVTIENLGPGMDRNRKPSGGQRHHTGGHPGVVCQTGT
jgi:osmotically inducible protein OsmC